MGAGITYGIKVGGGAGQPASETPIRESLQAFSSPGTVGEFVLGEGVQQTKFTG
jgi:hypothetical protein